MRKMPLHSGHPEYTQAHLRLTSRAHPTDRNIDYTGLAMKILEKSSADGNETQLNATARAHETALILACEHSAPQMALKLIECGADVNVASESRRTALLAATQKGQTAVAAALIEKGADVHARGGDGVTALMYAAYGGDRKVVNLLLEKGADPNAKTRDSHTTLMWAITQGSGDYIAIARTLIEEYKVDLDVSTVNSNDAGKTALIFAAIHARNEVALSLIQNGAGLDAQDKRGQTALHHACALEDSSLALALVSAGANVDLANNDNQTPLMVAAGLGRIDLLRALLEAGADTGTEHLSGSRPALVLAIEYGHADCAWELLHGDPKLSGGQLTQALGATVKHNYVDLALTLIDRGADLRAVPGAADKEKLKAWRDSRGRH